jgi:hypothetical protein
MHTTCKHADCGKSFTAERAGAQYCSSRCRTAAHRKRQAPAPKTFWHEEGRRRRHNVDDDLSNHLLNIAHNDDGGAPKTGRRYYYLALSHGFIDVDMTDTPAGKKSRASAYKTVTSKLGVLRMAGLLGWDMVLDLTRELDEWRTYDSPREARADVRRCYDEDRWLGQEMFPILIVEKDTLEPVCKPIAQRWQMPFASSRGYSSLTLQHDVATMLNRREAKTGQSALVYFISDLDPSGLDLQRAWREALDNFGTVPVVIRIGLALDQVVAHDLDRLAIEVKPSDSRSKNFVAGYGDRCWEADVLPVAAIERAIDEHIRVWLDAKRWNQRHDEIERARKLL